MNRTVVDLTSDLPLNDLETNKIFTFNKRLGTSGISGQTYEIYLALFLLLQGINKHGGGQMSGFYLASKMLEAESFGDLVFKYKCREKQQIAFFQTRHKDNPEKPKEKITIEKLLSEGDKKQIFNLKDYFNSYRKIRKEFVKQSQDVIFGNKFDDCNFIVFTNAKPDLEENQKNLIKISIKDDDFLNYKTDNYYYQLVLGRDPVNDQKIMEILHSSSDCKQLAKELVKSLFPVEKQRKAEITIQGIIKRYHAALAQHVIGKKKLKEGIFQTRFLEDNQTAENKLFRDTFFDEIRNKEQFRQKSTDEIISELKNMSIKLPDIFWEIDNQEIVLLPNDSVTEAEIIEFLNHLKLFINQSNVSQLEILLKQKMKSIYEIDTKDIDPIFAAIKNKLEEWWKENNTYLTENNQFLQEIVRISINFNVKEPVKSFTGRRQELEGLHRKIQRSSEKMTIISQVTSISGLGGIGKTELARRYIQEYKQYYDNNIIWINAENNSSLANSFLKLAKDALKIETEDANGKEKDLKSILEQVYKYFKKRKCLFIFDNADEGDNLNDILPYLTSDDNKLYILITSRKREWGRKMEVVDLNQLEIVDAIMLVKKSLNIALDDTSQDLEINILVEKLQCFPLALQQAIAYIQNQTDNFEIQDYLDEYDQRTRDLLSFENKIVDDLYAKSTYTTWQISIDKIKCNNQYGELCLKILNFIAYFTAEHIPRSIFLKFADNNEGKLKESIRILVDLCLLNGEQKQRILNIHRLVQEVIKLKLQADRKEEIILEDLLQLTQDNLKKEFIEHAISIWNNGSRYEKLIRRYSKLSIEIANNLIDSAKFKEASMFGLEHSVSLKNVLSLEHENTLTLQNRTAFALYENGQLDQALSLYLQVLNIQKKLLGPDDLNSLYTLYSIANVFNRQGHFDDALNYYEKVLLKRLKLLGEEHIDTLRVQFNLATTLHRKGNHNDALKHYKNILKIQKKILGDNNIDTLNTMNNIAIAYRWKGDYDNSLKYYEKVLQRQKENLQEDHPDTLRTMHNMAVSLRCRGDYDDALFYYEKVLEKQEVILGTNHPDTIRTVHNIANVLNDNKNYDRALKYYEQVYARRRKLIGDDHPDTLLTMHNIANALLGKGDYNLSLEYYEKILVKQMEKIGDKHPDTLLTLHGIGSVLFCKGDYDRALKYYQEVLVKRAQVLGEYHSDTLSVKRNIELLLDARGR